MPLDSSQIVGVVTLGIGIVEKLIAFAKEKRGLPEEFEAALEQSLVVARQDNTDRIARRRREKADGNA